MGMNQKRQHFEITRKIKENKEIEKRFSLFKIWNYPQRAQFLKEHCNSIRAVVGNATAGSDAELIQALPKLEIVSSFSVDKCKEKGIRVTNTPDELTEDVADMAIRLMLAVLRRLCECDRYVRSGKPNRCLGSKMSSCCLTSEVEQSKRGTAWPA